MQSPYKFFALRLDEGKLTISRI